MDCLTQLETAIRSEEKQLHKKFGDALIVNSHLDRKLVSFQGNRTEKVARWCKFKEGFRLPSFATYLTAFSSTAPVYWIRLPALGPHCSQQQNSGSTRGVLNYSQMPSK